MSEQTMIGVWESVPTGDYQLRVFVRALTATSPFLPPL
jgi:hypothetical protein